MLSVDATQPAGFTSFLSFGRSAQDGLPTWPVLGLGVDASLKATVGCDDATGSRVPNGILFIEAARTLARLR